MTNELVLEMNVDAGGSFFVECLADRMVNHAAHSDQLRQALRKALHPGAQKPALFRLHLVLDQDLVVE
jgi:hypothetical protein